MILYWWIYIIIYLSKHIECTIWRVSPKVSYGLSNNVSLSVHQSYQMWVLRWLRGKEPTDSADDTGDAGSIPGRGDPWRRACSPLQCSCLENPMDRGAWRAAVHGVTKSWAQVNNWAPMHAVFICTILMQTTDTGEPVPESERGWWEICYCLLSFSIHLKLI